MAAHPGPAAAKEASMPTVSDKEAFVAAKSARAAFETAEAVNGTKVVKRAVTADAAEAVIETVAVEAIRETAAAVVSRRRELLQTENEERFYFPSQQVSQVAVDNFSVDEDSLAGAEESLADVEDSLSVIEDKLEADALVDRQAAVQSDYKS